MLARLKRFANRTFNVEIQNSEPLPVKFSEQNAMGGGIEKTLKQILNELKTHRREIETIRFAATSSVMNEVTDFHAKQVLSLRESLEVLANTDTSLARFGDGEFRMMLRQDFNLRFQTNSPELQESLREVFTSDLPNLRVGFPQLFRDAHWSGVFQELWPSLNQLIVSDQKFVNAHISRPQVFSLLGRQAVDLWRKVWDNKNVTIVTGEGSRFDLIPQLFDNVASTNQISSTSVNAFTDLGRIVAELRETKTDVVLIALGPAGTVLAHQLAKAGIRALDIGHLTNSYLNVFEGEVRPEAVPVTRK
ncbi:GT-D fold domain-containing glycosyltransferase [Glutamicibacter sp. NPDC087344]|uniref:GT-D fold domain-containing glycosyltransferase n=1 Tax=Glutamicibacter sp. NPDC087344 TaxID=3363994 RepID=UPI0037FF63AA